MQFGNYRFDEDLALQIGEKVTILQQNVLETFGVKPFEHDMAVRSAFWRDSVVDSNSRVFTVLCFARMSWQNSGEIERARCRTRGVCCQRFPF